MLFATSVRENVRFGKEGASDAEVEEACRQANAHDFVLGFQEGYDTTVGPKGSQVTSDATRCSACCSAHAAD